MGKSKRRINYSKLIYRAILVIAITYVAYTFYDQHKEMQYLISMEQELTKELEHIQDDVDSLKHQIENSNTDEHIEKIAREHLKMVKKGEMIFLDLGNSSK